jgi:predicted amidohydrolase
MFPALSGESALTRGSQDTSTNARPIDTEFGKVGMIVCKDIDTTMLGYGLDQPAPFNEAVVRDEAFKYMADGGAVLVLGSSEGDYTADIAAAAARFGIYAAHAGQDQKTGNFNPWTVEDYAKYNKGCIIGKDGNQIAGTATMGSYASAILTVPKPAS